jgi:hypothetical protein
MAPPLVQALPANGGLSFIFHCFESPDGKLFLYLKGTVRHDSNGQKSDMVIPHRFDVDPDPDLTFNLMPVQIGFGS